MTAKKNTPFQLDIFKSEDGANIGKITKSELDVIKGKAEQVDALTLELETLKADVVAKQELETELETLKSTLGDNLIADLIKSKEVLADILKAKEVQEMEDTVEVVKGFQVFESDEEVSEVAKFLIDNKGAGADLILVGLEKAKDKVEAVIETENGTDLEDTTNVEQTEVNKQASLVSDLLKNRKNKS